jgi:hypothetical protein
MYDGLCDKWSLSIESSTGITPVLTNVSDYVQVHFKFSYHSADSLVITAVATTAIMVTGIY